jgi:hypothetical protein
MKIIVSILLLLATSLYILPEKDFFCSKHNVCLADMDEIKDDVCKKEKAKELFTFASPVIFIPFNQQFTHFHTTPVINTLLHTVETPPPDLA